MGPNRPNSTIQPNFIKLRMTFAPSLFLKDPGCVYAPMEWTPHGRRRSVLISLWQSVPPPNTKGHGCFRALSVKVPTSGKKN